MDEPPRPRTERLLNREVLVRAYAFLGLIEAGIAMGGFFLYLHNQGWSWGDPLEWNSPLYKEATTVTFAGIVAAQTANVFACRSDGEIHANRPGDGDGIDARMGEIAAVLGRQRGRDECGRQRRRVERRARRSPPVAAIARGIGLEAAPIGALRQATRESAISCGFQAGTHGGRPCAAARRAGLLLQSEAGPAIGPIGGQALAR